MCSVSFGARYEIYGKPSQVRAAWREIKFENEAKGIDVDFIDTSNKRNRKRLDRVVLTEGDVAIYKEALEKKKIHEDYDLKHRRELDMDSKGVWKRSCKLAEPWIFFWNSLPAHLKTVVSDPAKNVCVKATDALKALADDRFNAVDGSIEE